MGFAFVSPSVFLNITTIFWWYMMLFVYWRLLYYYNVVVVCRLQNKDNSILSIIHDSKEDYTVGKSVKQLYNRSTETIAQNNLYTCNNYWVFYFFHISVCLFVLQRVWSWNPSRKLASDGKWVLFCFFQNILDVRWRWRKNVSAYIVHTSAQWLKIKHSVEVPRFKFD